MQTTPRPPHPIALYDADRRHERTRRRLFERTGIDVGMERIAAIEAKIQWCQRRRDQNLPVAPILPYRFKAKKKGRFRRQYWRVLTEGIVVTFIVDRPTMRIISVLKRPRAKTTA